MLDGEERVMRLIGSALGDLAAARPAPDFVARARAHVDRAPSASPIGAWTLAALVAAGALALVVAVAGRLPRAPDRVVTHAAPTMPDTKPLESARQPAPAPPAAPRIPDRRLATASRRGGPVAVRDAAPEVLVPPHERQAIGRLFTSLRAGRPEVVSMLMNLRSNGGVPIEPLGVTVAPLRVDPLVVPALPGSEAAADKVEK